MTAIRFETAELSHRGGRKENQDAAGSAASNGLSCWVLADGLGGHGGGAAAARLAVDTILASFREDPACTPQALTRYLETANRAVCDGQQCDARHVEMRTTAVILVAEARSALWAHVGDTRLYYFSGGRIHFQTKDHSVPQAMCNAGEITADEIRFHEDRNRLLRSLGNRDNLRPAVREQAQELREGDAFLLATDGFWEYVTETEMEVEFAKASGAQDWLERMERRLKERAQGEHDNYSAIGVFGDNSLIEVRV
jgi:serine/threonine protein phosphatase PrpC